MWGLSGWLGPSPLLFPVLLFHLTSPGPPRACHVSSSQLRVWRGKISSHRLILGNWGRLGSGAGWAHGGKVRLHCVTHRLSQLVRKASPSDFIMVRTALTHINSTGEEAVTLSPWATFVSAAGEHHTASDNLLSEQMCIHRVNAYHLGGSHSEIVFIHKCILARINLIAFILANVCIACAIFFSLTA